VRSTVYRNEGSSAGVASTDHLSQSAFDFVKPGVEGRRARIEHDIPLATEFRTMEPEGLAEPALDAVALDGAAHRPRDGKSQTGTVGIGSGQTECGEQRAGDAKTFVINESEFGGTQDPGRPRKLECAASRVSWLWRTGRLFRR
jgi:hypothetical protein